MFEGSHRLQKGKGLGTGTCPSTSCGSPPLEKSGGGNPSSFTSGFFKRNLSSSKQFPVLPFYIKIKSTEVKNSASRFSSDCKPRSIPRFSGQTVHRKSRGNQVDSFNTCHALGSNTPLDDHQLNLSGDISPQAFFSADLHPDIEYRDPFHASQNGEPGLDGNATDSISSENLVSCAFHADKKSHLDQGNAGYYFFNSKGIFLGSIPQCLEAAKEFKHVQPDRTSGKKRLESWPVPGRECQSTSRSISGYNGPPGSVNFTTKCSPVPFTIPSCHQATQGRLSQSFYPTLLKPLTPIADD